MTTTSELPVGEGHVVTAPDNATADDTAQKLDPEPPRLYDTFEETFR